MNDPPLAKGDANKYMLRVIKGGNLPVISPHIFSFLPSFPNSILNSNSRIRHSPLLLLKPKYVLSYFV